MQFSQDLAPLGEIFPRWFKINKAVDRRTAAILERYARRMEPALREGFLAAIRSAKSKATLTTIEQAMKNIDPAAAIREATGGLEFRQMRETLAEIVEAAGARATNALITMTGGNLAAFDIVNPYAVQYARAEVGTMIREITQTTQQGIARLIGVGIEQGITPAQTAQQIRTMIGLTEQQTNWVLNYENKLLSAGSVDIDLKVDRYAAKLLRQRAQNIARTETIRAANGGQQAAWNAAVDQGVLPKDAEQVWIITDDEKICEICEPMPDMEENQHVPLNGVFITGEGERVKKPPAHPRCRCSVALNL